MGGEMVKLHGAEGCRCGHTHFLVWDGTATQAARCMECCCLHFVPEVVIFRPLPEHRPVGLRA